MTSIKSYLYLAGVVLLSMSSCNKFMPETANDDPTTISYPEPSVMLPTAQANLAYYYGGDISRIPSVLTQQMIGAANQWQAYDNYQFSDPDFGNAWVALYTTSLQSLNKMREYAKEKKYTHYQGVADVLSAFTYSVLVDFWGDVPYTEALQAPTIMQPKFDKGEFIYAELHNVLDNAILLLSEEDEKGVVPGNDDLYFQGDISKWIQFAHAIKARLYLHTVHFDATAASKALTEVQKADGINVVFRALPPNYSPAFQFQESRWGDISYLGTTMYNMMEAAGDIRLYQFVDTLEDAIGPMYYAPSAPVYLLSDVELKFMEAELLARANDPSAEAAYQEAVSLSHVQVLGNAGNAQVILDQYPYNAAETDLKLRIQPIMIQKYIALFSQPEVFSDWRRTGIPAISPTVGNRIPRRFLYPDREKNTNTNTPSNLTVYDKVWWDK